MPTCQACKGYWPQGGSCPRCAGSASQGGMARVFARQLRAQTAAPPSAPLSPSGGGGFWGPITGEVRREQDTWTGRASGTTLLTAAGLLAPLVAANATGSTTANGAVSAVFPMLATLVMPIALLVILMSLGRGGPLYFIGRMAGNTVNLGMGLASRRRGGPGRILIIEHGSQQSRVAVARPLDVPIGSRITVHGPRIAGYRHAWFIRVHGLDSHALPARGVLLAIGSLAVGAILTAMTLVASIGG